MNIIKRLLFALLLLSMGAQGASFTDGTVLTASQLNSAFANAAITGGTISGASVAATTLSATNANPSLNYQSSATGSVARSYQSKLGDTVSVLDFAGCDPTGVADSTACFTSALSSLPARGGKIYVPAGEYNLNSAIIYTFIATNESVTLYGDGSELTILKWPSGSGLKFNLISQFNSFHLAGLTFTTGSVNTGTGFNVTQTQTGGVSNPALAAQSDITDVTFRGADGYGAANYWANAFYDFGTSNINFINVSAYGGAVVSGYATATSGYGAVFAGTASYIPVQFNFVNATLQYLANGIQYGDKTQGMAVQNSNFTGSYIGINVPTAQTGLDQLYVAGSQFNCSMAGVNALSAVPNTMIGNNLFIVPANAVAVVLGVPSLYTILGNAVNQGAGGSVNNNGFVVGAGGSGGIIGGNVIDGMYTAIWLQSGSASANIQPNIFHSNTTNVLNQGSGNIDASSGGSGTFSAMNLSGPFYNTGSQIEYGSLSASSTPYLDFHSSGNNIDYDSRIIASGGTASIGQGTLNVISGSFQVNGKSVLTQSDAQAGQTCVAVTVGASPFAYTATFGGDVAIGGGTVSAITKTRASVVVWSSALASNDVPVRAGDVITITYTVAPTVYQCSN